MERDEVRGARYEGREMFREKGVRSFAKMISWRIFATITTMVLVYIFVGKVEIAIAVGGMEVFVKMVLYYAHERVWNKVRFGRHQKEPFVIWFTGLPCSGKSTLAEKTYDFIKAKHCKAELLDGDSLRSVFPNTSFDKAGRDEHIKRIGFLASKLEGNGIIVVSSFVSPYEEARKFVRELCGNFIEVHVSTPVEECEKRDVKGMYKKARNGEIKNFTGIDDPYEAPLNPELVIDTQNISIEDSMELVFEKIKQYL